MGGIRLFCACTSRTACWIIACSTAALACFAKAVGSAASFGSALTSASSLVWLRLPVTLFALQLVAARRPTFYQLLGLSRCQHWPACWDDQLIVLSNQLTSPFMIEQRTIKPFSILPPSCFCSSTKRWHSCRCHPISYNNISLGMNRFFSSIGFINVDNMLAIRCQCFVLATLAVIVIRWGGVDGLLISCCVWPMPKMHIIIQRNQQ